MYQNSLFYLQQGTAYIVEHEENSVFLLSNSLAFTLHPQDLGSKSLSNNDSKVANLNLNKNQSNSSISSLNSMTGNANGIKNKMLSSSNSSSNLAFKPINIELVQFKNSHYAYPLARQYADFTGKEFFDSHQLLQFNRAYTSARIVRATKGGYLCLICGILGFLPKTHAPRFLKYRSGIEVSSKRQGLHPFKTLYHFYDLCERKYQLSIPCRYLSRIVYPPKTLRGKFQFSLVYTSFPLDLILRERKNYISSRLFNKSNLGSISDKKFKSAGNFNSYSKFSNELTTSSNSGAGNTLKQSKKFVNEVKRPLKKGGKKN